MRIQCFYPDQLDRGLDRLAAMAKSVEVQSAKAKAGSVMIQGKNCALRHINLEAAF